MTAPEEHYRKTKDLLLAIPKNEIGKWLLNEGYYPEQYVVPPCFQVKNALLRNTPFYSLDSKQNKPSRTELEKISFPKSSLVDRTFGIYDFKIHHDIVWHMVNHWEEITEHLFHDSNKIYHYSFPIPMSSKKIGEMGELRAGRMIYEYIEMAEKDLLEESYNFDFILRTDITSFYHSIYTHSIAWALHSKETIRKGNFENYELIGNKLDLLIRTSNDGCTNGIPIGPAISDLIAEIILAAVDRNVSEALSESNIKFIGVRYKDDYRFLCDSKDDAHKIIKILQRSLSKFHLTLNEGKSTIESLPDGLFRTWKTLYQIHSLAKPKKISYKIFENTVLRVMEISKLYPHAGVIDKFLSEITDSKNHFKIEVNERNIRKIISLLVHLKERRAKSFPQILAIIEAIYNDTEISGIKNIIDKFIKEQFELMLDDVDTNLYVILWMSYFIKSNNLFELRIPNDISSKLLLSIGNSKQELFSYNDCNIYQNIESYYPSNSLLEYLKVFNRNKKRS